jgi:hypothetical protein
MWFCHLLGIYGGFYFVGEDEVLEGLLMERMFSVLLIPTFHLMGFYSFLVLVVFNGIFILWYRGCILLFKHNT